MGTLLFLSVALVALAQAAPPSYTIETLAGTDWNGDGQASTSAILVQPQGVAIDPVGNIYIADARDHRIRRVAPSGIISTFAGTGQRGNRGDGGPAVRAQLDTPYGVAADAFGNVYIAELAAGLVRRVSPDGIISTIAGGGADTLDVGPSVPGNKIKLQQPRDLATDRSGNVYFSDFAAGRVYVLRPSGSVSVVLTSLQYPAGLAVDEAGSIYIAESAKHRIRILNPGTSFKTLSDAEGRPVEFSTPTGIALGIDGTVYVTDAGVRTTTVTRTGVVDSLPLTGSGIALDIPGSVYATLGRSLVKRTNGKVILVAGAQGSAAAGDGRPASEWRFNSPVSLARDAYGWLHIADTGNGRVRVLSSSGDLRTATSQLVSPVAIAFDSKGRLYIADGSTAYVHAFDVQTGKLNLVSRGSDARPLHAAAMVFDRDDQLYVADPVNNLIRRVSVDGSTTPVAGGGNSTEDGQALWVKLAAPSGLAFDSTGALWFSEAGSGLIRKLGRDGFVTTIPGLRLKQPRGLRCDRNGTVFVADAEDNRIFVITAGGEVGPIAGSGERGFTGDGGDARVAALNGPMDLLIQEDGTVLVADTGNNRIRRLRPVASFTAEVPPAAIEAPGLRVLHAGTGKADGVAPGQLIYVEGEGLSTLSLGANKVQIVSAASTRLVAVVPASIAPGVYEMAANTGARAAIEIVPAAPAVLAVANQDGSVNSSSQPARRGSVISAYVTGEGASLTAVSARVGEYRGDVLWFGPAPGLPGIGQINIQTPEGFAPTGEQPLRLTFDGVPALTGASVVLR